MKNTGKSEERGMGRSQGWILCKDGFHRADPKWVSDRSETQPPPNNYGPTLVKKLSKSDKAGEMLDRPAQAKPKKAKTKVAKASFGRSTKASFGRSTYNTQAIMTNDGQVGGLARTLDAMKQDGFALFPQRFNAKYKTTGGFDSTTLGLQEVGDGTTFMLNTTKTYKFETQDGAQVFWEAIKEAKPISKFSSAPLVHFDPPPIKTGVNGSVLMDHLKKNSGEGWRRERKRTRAALKDEKTYIRVPLMKKKSKKVIKAGKEELSRRGNIERRGAEPESSPIKITEAVNKSQARTSLLPAKVNTSKMLVMIIQRAG